MSRHRMSLAGVTCINVSSVRLPFANMTGGQTRVKGAPLSLRKDYKRSYTMGVGGGGYHISHEI